jgi:hypothetical protein
MGAVQVMFLHIHVGVAAAHCAADAAAYHSDLSLLMYQQALFYRGSHEHT